MSTQIPPRRLLLIGLEDAEWDVFQHEANSGRLRYLPELLRQGVGGPLRPDPAPVRASAWTTIATGKRPHEHGVLHDRRPRSDGLGVLPVDSGQRQVASFGEILCSAGAHVHLVGWPVSHPTPPLNGVVVSDRFASSGPATVNHQSNGRPWVHPPVAAAELFARRVLPTDMDEMTVSGLIPQDARALPTCGRLDAACRAMLAETNTLFRVAKYALGIQPWDATGCVLPALSRCREIAREVRAGPDGAAIYDHLLRGCYEHLDLLAGQLIQLCDSDTSIMVIGAGGRRPFAILRNGSPNASNWPASASLLDIVPTLLTILQQPVGDDMSGAIWPSALENQTAPPSVATWETAVQRSHVAERELNDPPTKPADDALQYLTDLGYVDPAVTAAEQLAEQCRRDSDLHRARSLIDANQVDQAIEVLQPLAEADPAATAIGNLLAELYLRRGNFRAARLRLDAQAFCGAESARLHLLQARIELAARRLAAARQSLHVAERIDSELRGLDTVRGELLLRQRAYDDAAEAFQQATNHSGPTAEAEDGLAACALAASNPAKAAEHALRAVELYPDYGRAHYHLGLVFLQMDRRDAAAQAFQNCAAADHQRAAPYYWLARLASNAAEQSRWRRQGLEVLRRRRPTIPTG